MLNRAGDSEENQFFCDQYNVIPKKSGFYQLWVFHKYNRNLMNRQTTECYQLVLAEFQKILQKQHLKLTPSFVMCDYETAQMNAIETNLKVEVLGDNFHFVQAILRNLRSMKLLKKENLRHSFEFVFAISTLPYISEENVGSLFEKICAFYNIDKKYDSFIDYLKTTWFGENSLIPKNRWSHFKLQKKFPEMKHSNNVSESFNNLFRERLGNVSILFFFLNNFQRKKFRIFF